MNRLARKFLFFNVPVLALALVWLGFLSISTNSAGWFLIVVGALFSVGMVVAFIVKGKTLWDDNPENNPIDHESGDRSFWLIVLGMIFAFYFPPIEYLFTDIFIQPSYGMIVAGLGLIIVGSFLFVYARHVLRKWYSGHLSIRTEQVLVQEGPYHLIRHPAYLGYLLMAIGIGVGYASLIGIVNIIFLLFCLHYRIKVEEKLLIDHFGDSYLRYTQKTKKLIPFIW